MQEALLGVLAGDGTTSDKSDAQVAIEKSLTALSLLSDGDGRLTIYRCVFCVRVIVRVCVCVRVKHRRKVTNDDDDDRG